MSKNYGAFSAQNCVKKYNRTVVHLDFCARFSSQTVSMLLAHEEVRI